MHTPISSDHDFGVGGLHRKQKIVVVMLLTDARELKC